MPERSEACIDRIILWCSTFVPSSIINRTCACLNTGASLGQLDVRDDVTVGTLAAGELLGRRRGSGWRDPLCTCQQLRSSSLLRGPRRRLKRAATLPRRLRGAGESVSARSSLSEALERSSGGRSKSSWWWVIGVEPMCLEVRGRAWGTSLMPCSSFCVLLKCRVSVFRNF